MRYCTFLLIVSLFFAAPAFAANVTNYETEGNLAVSHELGCIPLQQIKNTYTSADLFQSFATCMEQQKLSDANNIFSVAGAYGYFDKLRVTDKTAHQAVSVLIMNAMSNVSPETKEKLRGHFKKMQTQGSSEQKHLCSFLRKLGPPDYYPAYMIAHGMGSTGAPIATDFDKDKAWTQTIDKYAHCK